MFRYICYFLILTASLAHARDQIKIVGSSTVYPFATVVGEEFGSGDFKTPVIESTGTGGGFQLFCKGVGPSFPDIINASRAVKDSEKEQCVKNGVKDFVEFKFGNDGIAFVNNIDAPMFNLSLEQLWQAMALKGPQPKYWSEVSKELPKAKIEILIPPPTSGTRDAWNSLVLKGGCPKEVKEKNKKDCKLVREDGVVIDAGENDSLLVKKLESNKNAFAIMGFSYLEDDSDKIKAAKINGVEVSLENIQSYSYPISRPLFFYVKKAHISVIPGIKEYVKEFISEDSIGQEGYLVDTGLVPLGKDDIKKMLETSNSL